MTSYKITRKLKLPGIFKWRELPDGGVVWLQSGSIGRSTQDQELGITSTGRFIHFKKRP